MTSPGDRDATCSTRCGADGGPLTGLINNAAGNFISRTEDLSPRAIDGGAWNAGGGGFAALRGWTDQQWTDARAMIQAANQQDRARRTV